jgi:hypothetical protein
MVRCRFKVIEKTELCTWYNCGDIPFKVKLSPVQGEPFGKATPSGSMEMLIINKEAADQLKVGNDYYVDFTPVGI